MSDDANEKKRQVTRDTGRIENIIMVLKKETKLVDEHSVTIAQLSCSFLRCSSQLGIICVVCWETQVCVGGGGGV